MRPGAARVGALDAAGAWICAAITVASILLKLWWLDPVGPVVFFDEMLYKLGAEAIAGNGAYPRGQYPFLYPALLAPALLLGAGYHGIYLTNVLLTSLLVPACYLLARTLGMRHAWAAAACGALLTLHVVFPTQVLSENAFVPAFAFATWFAVRGRRASGAAAVGYGLLLGGLFLIKYLVLPAIPLLWALWLANQRNPPLDAPPSDGGGPRWQWVAVASAASAAAFVGSWLWYARTQDITIARALGAGVSGFANEGAVAMQPGATLLWATAYLAVAVLTAGPLLSLHVSALSGFLRAPVRHLRESRMARFLLLVLLLSGGYWLVCIQHSATGAANYPVPQRVVARYLMLLTPLYLVAGLALLDDERFRPSRTWRIVVAVASVVAILLATGLLYHDLAWDFTDWFAAIPLYASDILWYRVPGLLGLALLLAAAAPFVGRVPPLRLAWMALLALLLLAALLEVDTRARRTATGRPVHARVLLPFVERAVAERGRVVVVSQVPESAGNLRMALEFWGVDRAAVRVVKGTADGLRGAWRDAPVLVATTSPGPGTPLQRYAFLGREAYVIDATRADPIQWRHDGAPRAWADPASQCPGDATTVTVHWDAGTLPVDGIEVFLVQAAGGREQLFARGGPRGSATTGTWVEPFTTFRLRPAGGERLLDQLIVAQRADCGAAPGPGGDG